MEFLKSQKGKQKLAFEGYMYICDRKTENKTVRFVTLCRLSKKKKMDKFHNFRYEHLWNHDFYAQESNIIFDIFDIFFDIFSILFRYFFRCLRCFFRYFSSIKSQFYILSYSMC